MATPTDKPTVEFKGPASLTIENRLLRVVVLPELGGRIWQISYKPLDADLLWHNPGTQPVPQPLGACYDDVWCGGWDELYPNDEASTLDGIALPDHGELWSGRWQAKVLDMHTMRLNFQTPLTHFFVEKELRLQGESARLAVNYRLTNCGVRAMPFLFKLHPAFAVSAAHRIDFPPMQVELEPDCPGTLEGAAARFVWPMAQTATGPLDLRLVPDASAKALRFFYGSGLREGWCGVTNTATMLAAALRFNPAFFQSCWLFATHGGWRDLNVAVLEPATGHPFRMQSMIDRGLACVLEPGETLETAVLFTVQPGLRSIGGVAADGRILPGDDH